MSDVFRFESDPADEPTAPRPLNHSPTGRSEYRRGLFKMVAVSALAGLSPELLYDIIERERLHLGEDWHGEPVARVLPFTRR